MRVVLALPLLAALAMISSGLTGCEEKSPDGPAKARISADKGLEAFKTVYEVLTHPRCLNCHPNGDRPLQHDDSRPHAMNVQRGPKDEGRPGMKCATCHGATNHDQAHLPPGSTPWRLAPIEMAFEDRTPTQLANQLTDPKQTHMSLEKLIHHVRDDALVGWGWKPGKGRAPVPVEREAFIDAFRIWIAAGTPIPQAEKQEEAK